MTDGEVFLLVISLFALFSVIASMWPFFLDYWRETHPTSDYSNMLKQIAHEEKSMD